MTAHEATVERLLQACKRAGRDEVARLAYQMARTCLSYSKGDPTHNIRWFQELRGVSQLRADLIRVGARAGLSLADDGLPAADPDPRSAVQMARACLDFTESIEGSSARVEFNRAVCLRREGRPEEALDRLEFMLGQPLTRKWYQAIQESRQTALLKLARYEQAAAIGEQLTGRDPRRQDAAFNLLTALAWMRMDDSFQESCRIFSASLVDVPDRGYWARLIADEAEWLALQLNRDPSDVMNSLAPPGVLPSLPPRSEP